MAKSTTVASAPESTPARESTAAPVVGNRYRIPGADAVSVGGAQVNAKDGVFVLTNEQVAALVEAGHKPVVS